MEDESGSSPADARRRTPKRRPQPLPTDRVAGTAGNPTRVSDASAVNAAAEVKPARPPQPRKNDPAAVAALLADLTPPQREAVTHTDGPLLILAGPGTGKTRVVTRRAAHLALTVADPRNVLVITFTNKAARELRERMDALGCAEGMTVGTFHSFCAGLLRRYGDRAGVSRDFTIFDREDRRKLLKEILDSHGMENSGYTPASLEQEISGAKNRLVSAEALAAGAGDWRTRILAPLYLAYEQRLVEMRALDFDDLLIRVAATLERDEPLRAELEHRYRYVLIDEYQDTNACQYRIARLLTREQMNLCATGDPDQSIYGWRGADIGNILSFEKDYPRAKVVRLEQNYRSTKRILALADQLIVSNRNRKAKSLFTENATGAAVRVLEADDAEAEGDAVAADITARVKEGVPAGEIAVFYRVNSLSRAIEEALIRGGVAYQVARGVEFYNRKEVKDVLAYLRVLVNPADEIALLRIINVPARGLGSTTIDRLAGLARQRGLRLYDALMDGGIPPELGRASGKLAEFAELMRNLRAALTMRPQQALAFVMSHSGLQALYSGEDIEGGDSPAANLRELLNAAAAFEQDNPEANLVAWLEYAALISDVDAIGNGGQKVTLMTLHAAKGLEFDCVYMIGMEDGLLPFRREDAEGYRRTDMEEERRLCFVGMTRARRRLTLSRALWRRGRGSDSRTTRSPFIDELPSGMLEWSSPRPGKAGARKPGGASIDPDRHRLPADIALWRVGSLVRHKKYGLGQITGLERGSRTHIQVLFRDGIQRAWLLEYNTELERVEFDDVGD